ncbi:hypothetical protein RND71_025182 [Anisodus tanguticus]|uniref:Uncharacterized protein n=1 Tax=Anisodus tanguticus TaxID=243964 RepID=A0AAE1RSG5_9SOLA|nr:hypothetical protein RND71_025182 [Anisodus tanguticus]
MENILPVLFSALKILEEEVLGYTSAPFEKGEELRDAFAEMWEEMSIDVASFDREEVYQTFNKLAAETDELAAKAKEIFPHILTKWHFIEAARLKYFLVQLGLLVGCLAKVGHLNELGLITIGILLSLTKWAKQIVAQPSDGVATNSNFGSGALFSVF